MSGDARELCSARTSGLMSVAGGRASKQPVRRADLIALSTGSSCRHVFSCPSSTPLFHFVDTNRGDIVVPCCQRQSYHVGERGEPPPPTSPPYRSHLTSRLFYSKQPVLVATKSLIFPSPNEVAPNMADPRRSVGEEAREALTVDMAVEKYVGEFGRGQFLHFVVVSLAWTAEAMHTMVMIFADRLPDWRCSPSSSVCSPSSSLCDLNPGDWEWVPGRHTTIVSEFGLVCGQQYKIGLVECAFFVGCIIGAGLFGNLSDSFLGRKGGLMLASLMAGACGVLTSFAPTYSAYLAIRLVAGLSVGGVGLCSFVLATEPIGPSKRGPVGMSAFYFFSTGIVSTVAAAYFTQTWRSLYLSISLATLAYSAFVLPFVSESPRWYLVKGRAEEALDVLRGLARRNRRCVPPGIMLVTDDGFSQPHAVAIDAVEEGTDTCAAVTAAVNAKAVGSLVEVFVTPITRWRMVMMIVIWFTCTMVYYGINLNVVNLGFNIYLSVLLNGLVEVPAMAITTLLLGRAGRRTLVVTTMLLGGTSCLVATIFAGGKSGDLALGFIPRPLARLLCGMAAISGMAGTYTLIFIYTCELFPTVVRNAALGLAAQAGQVGSITAPLIILLGDYTSSLPFVVFGVASIIGSLSAISLPETLNQPLWDTMEGLEKGAVAEDL